MVQLQTRGETMGKVNIKSYRQFGSELLGKVQEALPLLNCRASRELRLQAQDFQQWLSANIKRNSVVSECALELVSRVEKLLMTLSESMSALPDNHIKEWMKQPAIENQLKRLKPTDQMWKDFERAVNIGRV